jgi:arabinofuranosyltransferase
LHAKVGGNIELWKALGLAELCIYVSTYLQPVLAVNWPAGIVQERAFFLHNALLQPDQSWRREPANNWVAVGRTWRMHPEENPRVSALIGMMGFYAGPEIIIVDSNALADPLLARLPTADVTSWRVGHFERNIPDGYLEGLKSNSFAGMDANLARYCEKLRLITSGDLCDLERLMTIAKFNLGAYDQWRDAYLKNHTPPARPRQPAARKVHNVDE